MLTDHSSPLFEANPTEKNNDGDEELKSLPESLCSVTMSTVCYILYCLPGGGTEPMIGPDNYR